MKYAIVYVNQMFGQIGGEDVADVGPSLHEGCIGPAVLYQNFLGEDIKVTHTIVCGDNYMGSNTEEALAQIKEFLQDKPLDLFFAGPAFLAGRYGLACGSVCRMVEESFGVPVFTSMNQENPGMEMFRKEMIIFKGGKSARSMGENVKAMCNYALKVLNGEPLLSAEKEGYFGRGIRKAVYHGRLNSDRAVDMLIAKLNKSAFVTELPMLTSDKPAPAHAVKDLKKCRVAIVTTGGIVPAANPDRIQSSSATIWGKYSLEGMERLSPDDFICIHSGFDNQLANENPNIVAPVDAMVQLEKNGVIGEFYPYLYTTTGTGTAQAAAVKMAQGMIADMRNHEIDAAILTST